MQTTARRLITRDSKLVRYTPQVPPDYYTCPVNVGDIDHIFRRAGLTEAQEWETRRLLAHARARLELP